MSGGYYTTGKQVLWGTAHVADAKDNETATMIADALNGHPEALPDYEPVMPELPQPHNVRAESDEYACSCGMRWDRSEGGDHP